MPWSAKDAFGHTHRASAPPKRRKWAKIANAVRRSYLKRHVGADKADEIAIRTANARIRGESDVVRSPLIFEVRNPALSTTAIMPPPSKTADDLDKQKKRLKDTRKLPALQHAAGK